MLSKVKTTLVQSRGYDNEGTTRSMLALAKAYWGLGRLAEAIDLQRLVVANRSCTHDPDDLDTFSAMDDLGRSY